VITLGDSERRTLIALGRRQLDWNAHLGARIITTGSALGIYTTPPMDVMCFLAFPVTESANRWASCKVHFLLKLME
jgi:hypothetical protein